MEIIRLPSGQSAPVEADCIAIDTLPMGKVRLSGAALCGDESVSIMGTQYNSYDEAEEQGIAWAVEQGVSLLYVTTDAPTPGD